MGWNSFKHRFTPWLAINWSTRIVKHSVQDHSSVTKQRSLAQLLTILQRLSLIIPPLTPRNYKQLLSDHSRLLELVSLGKKTLHESYGFTLAVQPSRIQGGGRGVFVESGHVEKDQLVALYPGTVYLPYEPLLIPSIGNSYILRCVDGVHIDGKHTGLSGMIHRSCALRDTVGSVVPCDLTWMSLAPTNPLSVGQIVNNETREIQANVEYIELAIPSSWSAWGLSRMLPNVFYATHPDSTSSSRLTSMRTVGLVSTRRIHQDEELFSSYLTVETH